MAWALANVHGWPMGEHSSKAGFAERGGEKREEVMALSVGIQAQI